MHIAEDKYSTARSLLDETIEQGVRRLLTSQGPDGAWTDCFDTGVMADAQTVVSLYLLDIRDSAWTEPLLQRIETRQCADGSWEVYPGDGGDLSTTVECYYAMELHHRWQHAPARKSAARGFISERGGLKKCRNLTKVFLAVGGEIPWSWLPSPRVYSWLFASVTPVRIYDLVMFTRLHVPPMLLLSWLRYVSRVVKAPVLQELVISQRGALRDRHHSSIRSSQANPYRKLRSKRFNKCFQFMLNEREDDGTLAGYHSSTFLLLLSLRALHYTGMEPEFRVPLQSMKRDVYMHDKEGGHQQTCNAHIWNTSIALQALQTAGTGDAAALEWGRKYLLAHQQVVTARERTESCGLFGAWGFSSNNNRHPDTDDTVSCLEALYPMREKYETSWRQGVRWLLAMQNQDGGWSAFEKNAGKRWLEWIPANDMKRSMTDPSTADITARVLEFLIARSKLSRTYSAIRRGIDWLITQQNSDGSWFGRWGTTYIYGTWCAVRALAAANASGSDLTIERTRQWILTRQRLDGAFGESCESDVRGKYVPFSEAVSTQTAWGLDTIVHLLKIEESPAQRQQLFSAAHRSATWLLDNTRGGSWEDPIPTGSAFPGSLHIHYEIYPKVWPLMALSHYRDALRAEGR